MATQYLTLSLVACETSAAEIRELISGCQLADIGGTANTKYRDYSGEDILEELHEGGLDVQKAEHCGDDGASMLYVRMYVPDTERARVDKWIADTDANGEAQGALQEFEWSFSIGDTVEVPDPIEGEDIHNFAFQGNVIGFRCGFAQVEDGDNNVFDVEIGRLTIAE